MNRIINMPDAAKNIIITLNNNGYEAYIVGGCVRDIILGREPGDWDITTSALPLCVKNLFRRTIDTGLIHGTVTVMVDKEGYEVTTYRIDGEYKDGRHPDKVEFTPSLEEDLKRRDFTINAMAYNDSEGIVDMFGGLSDIDGHLIKCVGNPVDRFNEDALRMMRAVRFSAQLSFDIEKDTYEAIKLLCDNIKKVSVERVQVELTKTLCSEHPDYTWMLYDSGLSKYTFPVLDRLVGQDHFDVVKGMLAAVPKDVTLRLAAFYVFDSADEARNSLRSLRYDNKTIDTVYKLIKNFNVELTEDETCIRQLLNVLDSELFFKFITLRKAYEKALGHETTVYDNISTLARSILDRGDCYKISMLKVNGKDLMELGIPKGSGIGDCLSELLAKVIENPSLNEKEILTSLVKRS